MLPLIFISSLSFLVMASMVAVRLFNWKLKIESDIYFSLKKIDGYLVERWYFLKKIIKKYGNTSLIRSYLGRLFLYLMVQLCDALSRFFKRVKLFFNKYLRRNLLRERRGKVSEYLVSISDRTKEVRGEIFDL